MDCLKKVAKIFNYADGKMIKLILGKKGRKKVIYIDFSKKNLFHLIGFHYLTDIPSVSQLSSKIAFQKIMNGDITLKDIEYAKNIDQVRERINCLFFIYENFRGNSIIFQKNKSSNHRGPMDWNYLILIKNSKINNYLFLRKIRKKENHFVCISTFINNGYEIGNTRYTVLECFMVKNNRTKLIYKR